ncbi:hypothetical protein [Streptomyces sp. NPDC003857]
MAEVITASESSWTAPFTSLSPRSFRKLSPLSGPFARFDRAGRGEGRAAVDVQLLERHDRVPGPHHGELLVALPGVLRTHGDGLPEPHGVVPDVRSLFHRQRGLELPQPACAFIRPARAQCLLELREGLLGFPVFVGGKRRAATPDVTLSVEDLKDDR